MHWPNTGWRQASATQRPWPWPPTLAALIIVIVLAMAPVGHANNTGSTTSSFPPSLTSSVSIQHLADLTAEHVLVLHHHPQPYNHPGLPDNAIQVVHTVTTVRASPQQVMALLMDVEGYADILPQVEKSRRVDTLENGVRAHHTLHFKAPFLTFTPDIWVDYQRQGDTVLTETLHRGDLSHSVGHWQLHPIDDHHTLISYASWSDMGSVSWLLRMAFAAQPDFRRLSPLSANALTMLSFRQQLNRDMVMPPGAPATITSSNMPNLLADWPPPQVEAVGLLAQQGNLSLIAPLQRLVDQRGDTPQWRSYQAVTTFSRIDQPLATLQPTYSDLASYPAHIDAISRLRRLTQDDHQFSGHWRLGFNFAVFRLGIGFETVGAWHENQQQLDFISPDGDFSFLQGRWQWAPLADDSTLVSFSSAHDTDDDAPLLLKAIADIPFNQLFSGLFIGHLLIEGQQQLLMP